MTYNPLLSTEIEVGDFAVQELWDKIKQNFDHFNGLLGGLQTVDVYNGSFEIDSDSDTTPDGWTKNLYAGGSGAIDATVLGHGAQVYKFVHPGGAGNGGGYLTSDYIPVGPGRNMLLHWMHWATVASGIRVKVEVTYFDRTKAATGSNAIVFDSTTNPKGATRFVGRFQTTPATAAFMKIIVRGGVNTETTAGTVYFDEVTILPRLPQVYAAGDDLIAEQSTTATTWTSVGSPVTVFFPFNPGSGIHALFQFTAEVRGLNGCGLRFTDGTNNTNEAFANDATYYTTAPFQLIANPIAPGILSLQMQLKAATSQTAFGRKFLQGYLSFFEQ